MEFTEHFRFEKDGPVRRIILDRPEKHNALSVTLRKRSATVWADQRI